MLNKSQLFKEAHANASSMMQSPGWSRYGYAYCFQYALGGVWQRTKLAALSERDRRLTEIKSAIAQLDYAPLQQNIEHQRTKLQHQLSQLAA